MSQISPTIDAFQQDQITIDNIATIINNLSNNSLIKSNEFIMKFINEINIDITKSINQIDIYKSKFYNPTIIYFNNNTQEYEYEYEFNNKIYKLRHLNSLNNNIKVHCNKLLSNYKNRIKQYWTHLIDNINKQYPNNSYNLKLSYLNISKSSNVHSIIGKSKSLSNQTFSMQKMDTIEKWDTLTADDNTIYLTIFESRRYKIQCPIGDENNIFEWFKSMFTKINIIELVVVSKNLYLQCFYDTNLHKKYKKSIESSEEKEKEKEKDCLLISINNFRDYIEYFFVKLSQTNNNYKMDKVLFQYNKLLHGIITKNENKIKSYGTYLKQKCYHNIYIITSGVKFVNNIANYTISSNFIPINEFESNKYEIKYIYFCDYCNILYPTVNNQPSRTFWCNTCSKNNCTKCNIQFDNSIIHICSDNKISGYKQCPQCNINTDKFEGCDKMICSNCKCYWCYECSTKTVFQFNEIDSIINNNGNLGVASNLLYLHYPNDCISINSNNNNVWLTHIKQSVLFDNSFISPLTIEQQSKFIELFDEKILNYKKIDNLII